VVLHSQFICRLYLLMLTRVSLAGAVSLGGDLAYQSNLHMPFSPLYLPLFPSLSLSLSLSRISSSVSLDFALAPIISHSLCFRIGTQPRLRELFLALSLRITSS